MNEDKRATEVISHAMGALIGDQHAYNLARGLVWQSIVLLSAFAFDVFGYFRKSDGSATSIIRVLILCVKLCALAYQLVWLCNTPVADRNRDDTTVAVLAVLVILLFSVTDIVAMSVVNLSHTAIVFVACVAAFLHLLMTAIDRRARIRELRKLQILPFVMQISGVIGTAAVLGAFLWASAAVLSQTGERDLELAAIVLLGVATLAVVVGTLYMSWYLNRLVQSGTPVSTLQPVPPSLPVIPLRD